MTWKTFTNTICKAEIDSDVAYRIIQKLFSEAGSTTEFSEQAARKWLNEKRNCKVDSYFPDNVRINYNGLFCFFRNRPTEKLKNLQELFCSTKESGDAVDVNTDDVDTFCLSLVNQFLDLLRLQRIDASNVETLSQSEPVKFNRLPDCKKEDVSSGADSDQLLESSGDLTTIDDANIPRVGKHTIRSMLLPNSEECCYHCEYWVGDREHFASYKVPTYGHCIKRGWREQISSDLPCVDYKRRPKSLLKWW